MAAAGQSDDDTARPPEARDWLSNWSTAPALLLMFPLPLVEIGKVTFLSVEVWQSNSLGDKHRPTPLNADR